MAEAVAARDSRIGTMSLRMTLSRPTIVLVALIGPALVVGAVTIAGPLMAVVVLAFTDYQLGGAAPRFIGGGNFRALASDAVFLRSLSNTGLYSAVVVAVSTVMGLGLALLIEARTSLRGFYRTVHFLPVMAATIAVALVWEFMLHPNFGLVNLTLAKIGIVGPRWLQDPSTALLSLALIGLWQAAGFNMVLFLTGLTSIPAHLYEAAGVDGAATGWDRFWLVTWPLLRPITLFVLVVSLIRSFQLFETVQVVTRGGPQKSTEVLLFTMFTEAFEFFRTGRGAAIAMVFLCIVLVLTMVKVKLAGREQFS